ncbi:MULTISPECIES: antA/AntB antirepressor family protein [Flavobacterium]|uniref:Toxin-antitoxin system, toxin component n=1 Tax=Flavobacterium columnare TaxID=996 RepID=A0AA94F581_9FLAO|nr:MULTISPECIES: antA/AntB antirepressor family protein [Flavobacterium]MCH4828254.1 antA/AntB antirepressor family protein [Flavobacterium columnare]MCH4834272.1 antA/AntB antirepressor family protein [Flavobacterium columnare]QYS90688.1 antA/AntB antirepressor family protein [Flavobacterium covae]
MNQLINITNQNGTSVVSARDLHQFLEVETRFNDWISRRIEEYGFIENQDFEVLLKNEQNPLGGRPQKEYAITLDMAKELSMVEKNEKGRKARQYFIRIEKEQRQNSILIPAKVVSNGVTCLPYTHWLLQNGYSVNSGAFRRRIKKNPSQFVKGTKGWYISEGMAQYFLNHRENTQMVQQLPPANPLQLSFFDN